MSLELNSGLMRAFCCDPGACLLLFTSSTLNLPGETKRRRLIGATDSRQNSFSGCDSCEVDSVHHI